MPGAREMSLKSKAAMENRDREGWLSLFAPDGVVEDPVGPSMFDPDGKGHHGYEGIGAFYDMVTALYEKMNLEIRESYECANEVANVGTITLTLADGTIGRVNGVFHYRVTDEGKIASLRAFWEPTAIEFEFAS